MWFCGSMTLTTNHVLLNSNLHTHNAPHTRQTPYGRGSHSGIPLEILPFFLLNSLPVVFISLFFRCTCSSMQVVEILEIHHVGLKRSYYSNSK